MPWVASGSQVSPQHPLESSEATADAVLNLLLWWVVSLCFTQAAWTLVGPLLG